MVAVVEEFAVAKEAVDVTVNEPEEDDDEAVELPTALTEASRAGPRSFKSLDFKRPDFKKVSAKVESSFAEAASPPLEDDEAASMPALETEPVEEVAPPGWAPT